MFFHIEHTTQYTYPEPAMESFSEIRLRPRDAYRQEVSRHSTVVNPAVEIDDYQDYFGNFDETISVPFRHQKLVVTSICDVETELFGDPLSELSLSVSEASLFYRSRLRDLYDFLRPSYYVSFSDSLFELSRTLLPPKGDFATSIKALNRYIFENYKYKPGSTDVTTTVSEFIEKKKGVCQDFTHLMIGLCRIAGIPARYVSGYIETEPVADDDDRKSDVPLVGATASHAWLEVYVPNLHWVGLDPTNNMMEGERHVQIGIGRDYRDVPPLKGVFKGPNQQRMSVVVRVTRNELAGDEAVSP